NSRSRARLNAANRPTGEAGPPLWLAHQPSPNYGAAVTTGFSGLDSSRFAGLSGSSVLAGLGNSICGVAPGEPVASDVGPMVEPVSSGACVTAAARAFGPRGFVDAGVWIAPAACAASDSVGATVAGTGEGSGCEERTILVLRTSWAPPT